MNVEAVVHVHPAQDDDEHPPQPELPPDSDPDGSPEDFPRPKRDNSFSVLSEPHFSQVTSGFRPNTSFSKRVLQVVQWYS